MDVHQFARRLGSLWFICVFVFLWCFYGGIQPDLKLTNLKITKVMRRSLGRMKTKNPISKDAIFSVCEIYMQPKYQ